MNIIPWFRLRVSHDAEIDGIDGAELGEFAFDFVEVRRDFDSWNAPHPDLIDGRIEGRVREELEKPQELPRESASSTETRYSAGIEKIGTDDEGRAERELEEGRVLLSG